MIYLLFALFKNVKNIWNCSTNSKAYVENIAQLEKKLEKFFKKENIWASNFFPRIVLSILWLRIVLHTNFHTLFYQILESK